ncbi:MAG: murein transglycosylase A [Betaproteobacteria bacterium]|nr:murein transglycosylase A [Betaproteobacteria bacterium]
MNRAAGAWLALAALLAGLLAGCAVAPPRPLPAAVAPVVPRLHEVAWNELPGWQEDDLLAVWPAWLADCSVMRMRPAWRPACDAAARLEPSSRDAVAAYFQTWFSPWQSLQPDGAAQGLITGYYTPLLHGSLKREPPYVVPLYAQPHDLLTVDLASVYPELKGKRLRGRLQGDRVVPYWSRAQIDADPQLLAGNELVWVDDPMAAFFMQIQGSGQVELPDGQQLTLGYANQNGFPYRAIGKLLVERGELPASQVSMQSIRAWGKAHAQELPSVLAGNPAYVFFRRLQGLPPGAMGIPVVAGRSIAVDPRALPLGAPVWLSTRQPNGDASLNRLVLAQDTGGAIRGNVRADLYFGLGDAAGEQAGVMRQPGSLWVLLPKPVSASGLVRR